MYRAGLFQARKIAWEQSMAILLAMVKISFQSWKEIHGRMCFRVAGKMACSDLGHQFEWSQLAFQPRQFRSEMIHCVYMYMSAGLHSPWIEGTAQIPLQAYGKRGTVQSLPLEVDGLPPAKRGSK